MVSMENEPKKGTSLLAWILLVLILIGVTPVFLSHKNRGCRKKADLTNAVSNTRQIGIALSEFEFEYGTFPDESTGRIISQSSGNKHSFQYNTSNDYLSQLMAVGMIDNESMLYAKTAYTHKPGTHNGNKSLDAGEVGFGYFMNGKKSLSLKGNPNRPLLCSPLAYDGKSVSNRHFDPKIYDNKAVFLRMDNSVQSARIDPKTKSVQLGPGRSLFDTGEYTIWGIDDKPVIIPPLPAR